MANKQAFTPEEWTKILESVVLSGMAVTAADPSGIIGLLKESFASAGMLAKGKSDPGSSALVKDVVGEFETSEGRGMMQEAIKKRFAGASQADISGRSIEALREVSAILDAKAPEDAPAFKGWLREISTKVADAATEGGFLGFGGQRVSDL
ncbi:MAG: hypothetical protein ABUJ98_15165 [Hyphomicrobium sp.]